MVDPDEDCVANGRKFFCHIDRCGDGHRGVVRDEHHEICWRYGMRNNEMGRSWGNPFNKQDFVITNLHTGVEIILRRYSFIPSRFTIIGAESGTIRREGILRNRYTMTVEGRQLWTFRMPLFSIRFWGGTDESAAFWVTVGPSMMDWSILIKRDIEDQPLLAALSFIHNEWWNYL